MQRKVNGATRLYVFACGKDHVIRRAIGDGILLSGWSTIPNAPTCATQPSVVVEPGGSPRDIIGVYYRSVANRLIELWYPENDALEISDISNQAGLGNIKGMPIVASRDERDPTNLKVAVVAIQADNKVVSMDLYNHAWHRRWVYQSGSTPAVAYGLMAVATYGGQYFKPQIMLQTANNVFTVFTRTTWSSSYAYMYEVNFSGPGTPAFGRPAPECVRTGCAVFSNDNYSYPPGGISGHAACSGTCLATYIAPITSKDNAPWYAFSFSSVHTSLRDYSYNPPYGQIPNTGLWYYPLATGHTPPVGPYTEFQHSSFFGYHNNSTGADSLMFLNELDVSDALYPSPGVLIGL